MKIENKSKNSGRLKFHNIIHVYGILVGIVLIAIFQLIVLLIFSFIGIGSIVGMALLSVAISIPLSMSSKRLTWMHNGLQFVIGTLTLGIGLLVIYQNGSFLVA